MTASGYEFSFVFDVVVPLIPAIDLSSDILLLITSYHLIFKCTIFFAGSLIFGISQILRCLIEGMVAGRSDLQDIFGDNACSILSHLLFPFFPVGYILYGFVVVFEKILRVVLAPLDLFLCIGYCIRDEYNNTEFLIRDRLFCFSSEKDFFHDIHWLGRYWHMLACLSGGGRWQAFVHCGWIGTNTKGGQTFRRDVSRLALIEEILENIGGSLMAISVLLEDEVDETTFIISILSLALAGISGMIETGAFFSVLDGI